MQTDDEIMRDAVRPSYAHCANFVCDRTGVVLDTPEVDGRGRCVYCGGQAAYLKYWGGTRREMQHA